MPGDDSKLKYSANTDHWKNISGLGSGYRYTALPSEPQSHDGNSARVDSLIFVPGDDSELNTL